MISERSSKLALTYNQPWRFPPGKAALYDKEKNPNGIISFATAENFLVHDVLEEYIKKISIPKAAFTYEYSNPSSNALSEPLSRYINTHFNPHTPILPSQIITANGVTAVNDLISFVLADPGDAILINRPIYGRFEVDFKNRSGVKVVYADTEALDVCKMGVVKSYEEAIEREEKNGVRVRALLIVNPHNPLGRCYPPEVLRELMAFCQKKNLHFISDEIYSQSVFDSGEPNTRPFSSVLSIDFNGLMDENYIHVTYGMAKDFSVPGLKIGFLISRNPQVRQAVTWAGFSNASGVSIAIASQILSDEQFVSSYLTHCRETLARSFKFATGLLRENNISYLPGSNAGYFLWIDLSASLPPSTDAAPMAQIDRQIALTERFVAAGVFVHPSEERSKQPGWYRLVYTQDPEIVAEGIRRLVSVLKSLDWASTPALLN